MRVLVDTTVWSLALRRHRRQLSHPERAAALVLRDLLSRGLALLIDPVRQEVLSGVKDESTFEALRQHLRWVNHEALTTDDFESAARCFNRCQSAGVAGSGTDMLICAVAIRLDVPIWTTDADFTNYSRLLPIRLPTTSRIAEELRNLSGEDDAGHE